MTTEWVLTPTREGNKLSSKLVIFSGPTCGQWRPTSLNGSNGKQYVYNLIVLVSGMMNLLDQLLRMW